MVGALFLKICGEVFGYFPLGFPAGDFGYTAVMFPFKVCGAYIFGAVQVFAQCPQSVYIVAPCRCIRDFIAVTDGDTDTRPIFVESPTAIIQIQL